MEGLRRKEGKVEGGRKCEGGRGEFREHVQMCKLALPCCSGFGLMPPPSSLPTLPSHPHTLTEKKIKVTEH